MTIISERVENIFNSKRLQKSRPSILKNTVKFSKKFDIKILYSNKDFLTIKIQKNHNIIHNIENNLLKIYDPDDLKDVKYDLSKISNKFILLNKFYIIYNGLAFGEQKKVYSIYDQDKNKVGQIVLLNEKINKKNTNVINTLEFKGLFFKSYNDYLNPILRYFKIDRNINGIVKRFDFCVDFQGIEVFELLQYLKDIHTNSKNVNALSATDKKKLINNNLDFEHGRQITFKNFFTSHNDLKIYDKILDILDNHTKRTVNGKNPYQEYLDSEFPITRIEVKKKKFQNLHNNSINWLFDNIESLFFDHLNRYFKIDLSLYKGLDLTLNGKKIFLAKEEKQKSLYHSMIMAQAYLSNIKILSNDKDLYGYIYNLYPELENIRPMDLIDEFSLSDFFNGTTDTIKTN